MIRHAFCHLGNLEKYSHCLRKHPAAASSGSPDEDKGIHFGENTNKLALAEPGSSDDPAIGLRTIRDNCRSVDSTAISVIYRSVMYSPESRSIVILMKTRLQDNVLPACSGY